MKEEPKIHFASELLHTVSEDSKSDVYTAEIIFRDQVIVTKESSFPAENNAKNLALDAGQHTVLSEDGATLRTLITGYPLITRSKSEEAPAMQVDIIPLLLVSEDNMQAMLTLYPPPSGISILDEKTLKTILQKEWITYGIDQATLAESIEKQAALGLPLLNIPIARGVLPINGKDAYLRFEVEIGPIPGKILRDGTIDFRERKIFTGVDANQVIATRVAKTNGIFGINVFGEAIPPQPGNDITVKVSGDVNYSPETGQVTATKAGVLSTVDGVFCCAGNFTGGNVGSLRGGPATVAAGVDGRGRRYTKYKKLKAQTVDLEAKLETLNNREEEKGLVEVLQGAANMFVNLWMHENIITVRTDSTIADAEVLMNNHKIRRLPVIDEEGHLLGILSKEDIKNALPSIIDANFDETARALAHQAKVEAFMTMDPITSGPLEPLEKVAATMRKNKIGGIPVVTENKLVGIITESDIFEAFTEILGGNEEGVRIELSIDSDARSIFRTVDVFRTHEMNLLTMVVCNDFSTDNRLLTIRCQGEEDSIEPLIDDLWSAGCKINSIIRE